MQNWILNSTISHKAYFKKLQLEYTWTLFYLDKTLEEIFLFIYYEA